jgi:hypothetical protein
MRNLALTIALVASLPAAAQEPSFEALGQAPIVAGDRVRARDRALDEALRQAVEQATSTVLEPSELVSRAADLRLRIYPKAKSYVTNYRILDEGEETAGTFQVHLSAQVATARLSRDLTPSSPGVSRPSAKSRAVACADVKLPPPPSLPEARDGLARLSTTNAATPVVTAAATQALRDVLRARNVDAMPGPDPCDDARAADVAKSGAGQAALVAHVDVTAAGAIRGTDDVAATARADVKLVEPDGRASAAGSAERGGYAPTLARAAESSARLAVGEAARSIEGALAQRWSGDASPSGGVPVRVTGVARWADYQAVTRALATMPGVAAVEPRRFSRTTIDLVVHTASAASQLAAHLSRVPPAGVHATVRAVGDGLQIDVSDGDAVPERG